MVIISMTSFVFGVFEYARLFMDWNLLNNAAREGCRYALANNTSTTISTDVQTNRHQLHGGADHEFQQLHRDRERNAPGRLDRRSTTWARAI